jgi:hypothetical protein
MNLVNNSFNKRVVVQIQSVNSAQKLTCNGSRTDESRVSPISKLYKIDVLECGELSISFALFAQMIACIWTLWP